MRKAVDSGTYKTVKAKYKTVKARNKTVKDRYKTVKARFWPWLEPLSVRQSVNPVNARQGCGVSDPEQGNEVEIQSVTEKGWIRSKSESIRCPSPQNPKAEGRDHALLSQEIFGRGRDN